MSQGRRDTDVAQGTATMTDPSTHTDQPGSAGGASHAYTRAAVDEYINAIWQRRHPALAAQVGTRYHTPEEVVSPPVPA